MRSRPMKPQSTSNIGLGSPKDTAATGLAAKDPTWLYFVFPLELAPRPSWPRSLWFFYSWSATGTIKVVALEQYPWRIPFNLPVWLLVLEHAMAYDNCHKVNLSSSTVACAASFCDIARDCRIYQLGDFARVWCHELANYPKDRWKLASLLNGL